MFSILAIFIVGTVVIWVLRNQWNASARSAAVSQQTSALTTLADTLDGRVIGPDGVGPWSPKLQRAAARPYLTMTFQRGPWHVRVTEVSHVPNAVFTSGNVEFGHWIEAATVALPKRRVPLEFFTLHFEDGFVHAECQGKTEPDELLFLVDMILETLDLMPGVEPRDPTPIV